MHRIFLVVLTLLSLERNIHVWSASPSTSKHYRTDYVYDENTDAFYKLHIEGSPAFFANEKCVAEGARLVDPLRQQDLLQVHAMFKKFPDLGQFVVVSSDGAHYETTEDPPPMVNSSTSATPATKQYRADYEYNQYTDAFYKLHPLELVYGAAKRKCQLEGATLMVPENTEDIQQLYSMFKKFPDLGNYVRVESDELPHDSAEEPAQINMMPDEDTTRNQCDVVTRDGDVETMPCWRRLPFMCKLAAKDVYYNEECRVYSRNYVSKVSITGSCYSISPVAGTWNEGYAECEAEGAHLVILNSETEREEVKKMIQAPISVVGAWSNFFFFAGFRADRPTDGTPTVFRTVRNQTLEESGFAQWSANEPNNYMDSEYCGSLFKNDGLYNDLGCYFEYAYVCEKERQIVNQ